MTNVDTWHITSKSSDYDQRRGEKLQSFVNVSGFVRGTILTISCILNDIYMCALTVKKWWMYR
jgi:hypothetical protein